MIKINLLPKNYKPKRKIAVEKPLIAVLLIVYIFIAISFFILKLEYRKEHTELAKLKTQLKKYQYTEQKLKTLKALKENLKTRLKIIIEILKENPVLIKDISIITNNIPRNKIFLEELNCNLTTIEIKGNSESLNDIATYIKNLEKTKHFAKIKLKETKIANIENKKYINFNLKIEKNERQNKSTN